MKLIKSTKTMGGYETTDGKFRTWKGYPSLNALQCWIVEEKGDKKDRHFKTLKEAKEYINEQYNSCERV